MTRLYFKESKDGTFVVRNGRKQKLGDISYYEPWGEFVWEQELCMIMSQDCLAQVVAYMKALTVSSHDAPRDKPRGMTQDGEHI